MGTIIKLDLYGVEQAFEVVGEIGFTHTLNNCGIWNDSRVKMDGLRLRLIRQRHTFGLNVYEEDGVRPVLGGEWWLGEDMLPHFSVGAEGKGPHWIILKPIGTISEDGKTLWKNDGTHENINQEIDNA